MPLSESHLDAILRARTVIARYGERDALVWWDDESLTSSGTFVMGRLFPRTAIYAQIETAIEAATLRHQALVPQPARLTLFRLPSLLESSIRQHLLSLKHASGREPLAAMLEDVDVRQPLDGVLIEFGGVTPSDLDAVRSKKVDRQVVELGALSQDQLDDQDELVAVIRQLSAGYVLGTQGNLVIPFFELERSRS